ncbi:hypothetical protein [Streptomyces sp. NPDC088246]|uniref:hypothetical protein n=1 Tax=Streptomyces sp. NPDC088246 TaxID=3365842 RepID=UPI0038227E69
MFVTTGMRTKLKRRLCPARLGARLAFLDVHMDQFTWPVAFVANASGRPEATADAARSKDSRVSLDAATAKLNSLTRAPADGRAVRVEARKATSSSTGSATWSATVTIACLGLTSYGSVAWSRVLLASRTATGSYRLDRHVESSSVVVWPAQRDG